MTKSLMALMALTMLTACDRVARLDLQAERSDRLYQSAMEDYRSGRIDAAVASFRKLIRKSPDNASARFQLACLLQDTKKDHLNAFCEYHEYLQQHPESDKSKLARDRLFRCEAELAKELAEKHGLLRTDGLVRELEETRKSRNAVEKRLVQAEKDLESLRARIRSLTGEHDRLVAVLKGESATESSAVPKMKEVRDLLEEEEPADVRPDVAADAKRLKLEEADEVESGSSLLPVATNHVAKAAASDAKKPAPPPVARPDVYVVQDGDTLYSLSKRFYGNVASWKRIRDANKGQISADNRLRVGMKLKLP